MNEIKIHDIKGLVEVPDYSFYIFYGLIICAFILLILVGYFIYKFIKNKKQDMRKEYYQVLKNIDFTNSKTSAYTISKYGLLLVQNDTEKQLLNNLVLKLEEYKYKKEVPNFDKEAKASFDIFIKSLDI